jgi:hypothetical protein
MTAAFCSCGDAIISPNLSPNLSHRPSQPVIVSANLASSFPTSNDPSQPLGQPLPTFHRLCQPCIISPYLSPNLSQPLTVSLNLQQSLSSSLPTSQKTSHRPFQPGIISSNLSVNPPTYLPTSSSLSSSLLTLHHLSQPCTISPNLRKACIYVSECFYHNNYELRTLLLGNTQNE